MDPIWFHFMHAFSLKETWVHLKGNFIFPKGNLISPKRNANSLQGTMISPKGNMISRKGNMFSPQGNMISPKGNMVSPKGIAMVRGVWSGSLPGPEPNVVASALVFLEKWLILGTSKKSNVSNPFFHFSELRDFSRLKKRDRIRTIKVTDSDYALLREVRVPQPYMWFQFEPWIKSDKKSWKIVKIWSRTHVRELQLFAKNRQKKWCAKTFFARTWKKLWKSEKKLDQNSIFLLEKSVHSNYVDRVSDPNLKSFSNLIQIWIKFEALFFRFL